MEARKVQETGVLPFVLCRLLRRSKRRLNLKKRVCKIVVAVRVFFFVTFLVFVFVLVVVVVAPIFTATLRRINEDLGHTLVSRKKLWENCG